MVMIPPKLKSAILAIPVKKVRRTVSELPESNSQVFPAVSENTDLLVVENLESSMTH
jgi:hypothetical protein